MLLTNRASVLQQPLCEAKLAGEKLAVCRQPLSSYLKHDVAIATKPSRTTNDLTNCVLCNDLPAIRLASCFFWIKYLQLWLAYLGS